MKHALTLILAVLLTACGGGEPEADYAEPTVGEALPPVYAPNPGLPRVDCAKNPEQCK